MYNTDGTLFAIVLQGITDNANYNFVCVFGATIKIIHGLLYKTNSALLATILQYTALSKSQLLP